MSTNEELLEKYHKIIRDMIKGSILVSLKAKKFYKCFSSWMSKDDKPVPFDELPLPTQKAWILASHGIPASIEELDDIV